MAKINFTEELMRMEIGEQSSFPIITRDTVSTTASRLGLKYDRYYRLCSCRENRTVTVTREK